GIPMNVPVSPAAQREVPDRLVADRASALFRERREDVLRRPREERHVQEEQPEREGPRKPSCGGPSATRPAPDGESGKRQRRRPLRRRGDAEGEPRPAPPLPKREDEPEHEQRSRDEVVPEFPVVGVRGPERDGGREPAAERRAQAPDRDEDDELEWEHEQLV